MRFVFTPNGWEDYRCSQLTDRTAHKRINLLLDDIARDPFDGIGKPEQLRHALAGTWSRRVDEEHRLVYLVQSDDIVILQARYHYGLEVARLGGNGRAPAVSPVNEFGGDEQHNGEGELGQSMGNPTVGVAA